MKVTDTKLLNWMHNYQAEIVYFGDGRLRVTIGDDDAFLEETGIAVRPVLQRLYQRHQAIINFGRVSDDN